jgi:hypothetical protein
LITLLPASYAQHHKKTRAKPIHVVFPPPIIFELDPYPLPIDSVSKHIYEAVIVTSKVYGLKSNKKQTLLYLGAAFPSQNLTVILRDTDTKRLAKNLKGKRVSVTGKLFRENDLDDGRPVMYISDPHFLKIVQK